MDDESGESMELMEEMPLKELGEAELERLVRGWQRGAGNVTEKKEHHKHTQGHSTLHNQLFNSREVDYFT